MSQRAGDRGSISMARNNSPESYQNFLDNFGSVDIFTGKPHAPYTGPTQEEFEAEERARLGDDLFFKYYPDAQRDDVSQPNTTGGLGGLGSIFDIIKKQMPAPPVSDGGPILGQGPGKGRRQMPTGPISDNRMPSPTGPFEGGPAPLPTPYEPPVIGNYKPSDDELSRGQNYTVGTRPDGTPVYRFDPDGMEYLKKSLENEKRNQGGGLGNVNQAPQMPTNDPLKLLQEALKQKQNREMPQRTPPPMRGDMRKKGLLGGLIEKLEMQAAQKAEQPQMPTRPRTRGGMFGKIASSPTRGGSGGILPRAGGEPDLEQLRKQIRRGISVRGIGI